jgi:microsomal dipeptidase-like Zn-dependent dipeptidase
VVSGRAFQAGDPIGYHPQDAGYRIRVTDSSTTAHISVDDFWLTVEPTVPVPAMPHSLWGFADLHAHVMNELGTLAFDGSGPGIAARALWGSAAGPLSSMGRCNALHTTNDNIDTSPQQFSMHEPEDPNAYTLCRDICLDKVDEASDPPGHHNTNGGYGEDWAGWPVASGAIHQQMHWSWVKRAWQGGLRLMVATVGNSEVIGYGMVGEGNHAFLSDQDALALQIPAIKRWAASPDVRDWAEVAYTPQDARRIIGAGKLALVLGVELDHVIDDCSADVAGQRHHVATARSSAATWASAHGLNIDVGDIHEANGELDILSSILGTGATSWFNLLLSSKVMHYAGHPATCTDPQIEARLDALYRAGVRHVIPMHFSDNMLGGYAITKSLFYASAIFGDRDANPPAVMRANTDGVNLREFRNDLGETVVVPIWLRLDPILLRSLVGGILPDDTPPALQSFADALTNRCIEDDGWRAFFGALTLGASELGCLATDEAREILPWEGLVDTPAMIGLGLPRDVHAGAGEALPSHVNNLGLTDGPGRTFMVQMMRRGMLVDLQHASERAKNDIALLIDGNPLAITGGHRYPTMASHGGVELHRFVEPPGAGTAPEGTPGLRENENILSRVQFDRVYAPGASGLVGIGTQSGEGFRRQIHDIRSALCPSGPPCAAEDEGFGIALGSDINGFDWHALPRFAGGAGGGARVRYAAYDRATNPGASAVVATDGSGGMFGSDGRPYTVAANDPLIPLQLSRDGRVRRTYDVNFDGLAQYGLLPDFLEDVRVLGATEDDLAPVFRSADATVRMWEESCRQAYAAARPDGLPSSLSIGCGSREELGR